MIKENKVPKDIHKLEWELLIEEYKSLREEALAKMERQYRVIGLGIGGIGILLGIAFQFQIYPLFLILPTLIILSMVLFDSERDSLLNIGEYIAEMEKGIIINNKLKGWEMWIRMPKDIEKQKEKTRREAYKHFDYASFLILFFLLLGCILGIICFSGQIIGFEGLTNIYFRYSLSFFYILVGLFLLYRYCAEAR
ncbi:hypothetical protein [Methanobacterium oryzae]|uniref:hypothetical protein n=1 Tax=Methanobacterium oryzae TaxID=69540 RepID=UPI003D25D97A